MTRNVACLFGFYNYKCIVLLLVLLLCCQMIALCHGPQRCVTVFYLFGRASIFSLSLLSLQTMLSDRKLFVCEARTTCIRKKVMVSLVKLKALWVFCTRSKCKLARFCRRIFRFVCESFRYETISYFISTYYRLNN